MRIFRIIPILAIACLAFAQPAQAMTKLYTEYIVSTNGTILYTGETGRGESVGIAYGLELEFRYQGSFGGRDYYNNYLNYCVTNNMGGGDVYYALVTELKDVQGSWPVDSSEIQSITQYVRYVGDTDRIPYVYSEPNAAKKVNLRDYLELDVDKVKQYNDCGNLDAFVMSNNLDSVTEWSFGDTVVALAVGKQVCQVDYECTLCYTNTFGTESFSQIVTNDGYVAANTFSRTGYTFANWNNTYNPGDEITNLKNDVTFVAQWTANQYTVTLDQQGGSSGTSSVTATYDAGMPSAIMPTRTGYTFGGYFTETGGNGTLYYGAGGSSANKWNIAGDATLYAKWTADTYTVTLNQQSGSGGTGSVTARYDAAMPSFTKPERTGYTFDGYFTETNGGGTQYYNANGESVQNWNIDNATTLYAKWKANNYTVSLDPQPGSGGTGSVTATYDAAMPSFTKPERTGYTFDGYFTGTNGSGTRYYNADGSSAKNWNIASNTTLYAKWVANTYTVSLEPQPGSGGTGSVTATYDATMPSLTKPTRTGYTFDGYFTKNGVQYYNASGSSEKSWDIASNTTLYAHWTAKTYTVTLNQQSGSGGTGSVTATYDATMPSFTKPERTGYTFEGYFTETNGGGTQYYGANGESVQNWNIDNATTLYAKWRANNYTVSLDQQSGSGGTGSVTATYDAAMPSFTKPERTGYTFDGYFTGTNGSGTRYYNADGSSAKNWNIASNTTLYAKWTANTYTVTLDRQGSNYGSSSVKATYDAEMPTTATMPQRTGYEFGGYFTAANGGGTQYYNADGTSAKNWNIANDTTTLYAKWTANNYTVSLDPQPGSGGTRSVTATYDATMPSVQVPTRAGYTFKGYFTGQNGYGTQYYNADGTSAKEWNIANDTTTLYAKWDLKNYTVTLDPDFTGGVYTNVTATYSQKMPNVTPPEREGYSFGGYFTYKNGVGTGYYNLNGTCTNNCDFTVDTTLYAKWIAETYKVTLDQQSGSNGTEKVFATYDAAMPDATKPDREGYVFGGYFTSTNGLGKKYYNADMSSATNWNIASDTTLYAQWTESDEFYITFVDIRGSETNNIANVVYTNGVEYASLPLMTREGYDFAGWWTTEVATNRVQQVATNIANKTITKLYARWKLSATNVTVTASGTNYPVPWGSEFSDVVGSIDKPSSGSGKSFAWWCCDGKPVQDDFIVTNSMTLTPQYTIEAFSDIVGIPELAFDTDMHSLWCASNSTKTLHSGAMHGNTSQNLKSRLIARLKSPGSIGFYYEAILSGKEKAQASLRIYKDNQKDNEGINIKSSEGISTNGTDSVLAESVVYWQVGTGYTTNSDNHAILSNINYQPEMPAWTNEWSSTNSPSLKLVTESGPGVLTFKWRVNGETGYVATNGAPVLCDYLKFSELGGGETLRLEGFMATNEFVEVAITNTTAEAHTFVWRYVKDYDVKVGDDAAWVTDIVWTPLASTSSSIEYKYTKPDGTVAKKSLSVPNDWVDQYGLMDFTSATDYLSALTNLSGKIGFDGSSLPYWADYIAGTDPTNAASVFSVTNFTISADGSISIEWSPNLTDRAYTIFGKTNLVDALWTSPTNSSHRFFRVEVSLP